jgi:hypothetical protein
LARPTMTLFRSHGGRVNWSGDGLDRGHAQ